MPGVDKVITVCQGFEEAARVDLEQWMALSGSERLLAGEALREEWAERDGEPGFRRILRLAQRSEG